MWPDDSLSLGRLVGPFGVAMVAVLWAYDGWIEVCYVGGEVKDPGRNLPRAVVLSTLITIALFCLVTASYTYVLSPAKMAQSPLVASDAAQVTLGPAGAALVAATILISTLGANNGIVLTAARIPYAMARDGLLPAWLGGVHPRFLTPAPSLVVQGLVAIALTLGGTYDQLFTYVVFAQFLFYAMACGAVVRLRHRTPALARPYRTWGYPVTPVVFIAFATWLVANTIVEQPTESAVGVALMLAGLPVYVWKRRRPSSVSRQPLPTADGR
jgi:APA family basic amino acid/polyamine antiporter